MKYFILIPAQCCFFRVFQHFIHVFFRQIKVMLIGKVPQQVFNRLGHVFVNCVIVPPIHAGKSWRPVYYRTDSLVYTGEFPRGWSSVRALFQPPYCLLYHRSPKNARGNFKKVEKIFSVMPQLLIDKLKNCPVSVRFHRMRSLFRSARKRTKDYCLRQPIGTTYTPSFLR